MAPHLSRKRLARALSEDGDPAEADAAVAHLLACRPCQDLAAEELGAGSARPRLSQKGNAFRTLFKSEECRALDQLRCEGWWAELAGLAPEEQRERVRSVLALQSKKMFEVVIAEASRLAADDPYVGEEMALTARVIAALLPRNRHSEKARNDLQGEALIVVAKCRRLGADWPGSKAALQEAWSHLGRGTGDPKQECRLLSIAASLASDTGNLESALGLLARAEERARATRDAGLVVGVAVKVANTLLAGCRFEEALGRAEEALQLLSPGDSRLEMLARSIATECLIELGRPTRALRSFLATRALYDAPWGRPTRLKVDYLKARLLDAFGHVRESEKALRVVIAGHIAEGTYKDAFLYTLTLFDSLCRRGALGKAAELCEEAAGLTDTPFCHSQMGKGLGRAARPGEVAGADRGPAAGGAALHPPALERPGGPPAAGRRLAGPGRARSLAAGSPARRGPGAAGPAV
ncbi:MAG TPA: hypothetical protein VN493_16245 [Thermoanaerobaculia bacterium]|nr:hypothetical protein [Thermoanaerobaculia bacterium]